MKIVFPPIDLIRLSLVATIVISTIAQLLYLSLTQLHLSNMVFSSLSGFSAISTGILMLCILWYIFLRKLNAKHLPPGPKGKLVIGNVFDMPASTEKPWLFWLRHKDMYGSCYTSFCSKLNTSKKEKKKAYNEIRTH